MFAVLGSRITLATLVEGVHNGRVPQDIRRTSAVCLELLQAVAVAGSVHSFREHSVAWHGLAEDLIFWFLRRCFS